MTNSAFAGKVALVTGAASGIGRATALAFAHEGARVVVADRDEAGAAETARLIEAQSAAALVACVDVAQEASVAAMMARAVEAFGRVDLAVNSAGVASGGARLADFEEAAFDQLMAVNLKGVFLCLKHQLRQMAAQGGGAIVNIGSIASFSGMGPGRYGGTSSPAYIASKHAVVGLTRAAAVDYARDNVRVNAVCPGVVRTPMYQATLGADAGAKPSRAEAIAAMHPLGRLAEVEEVADAVLWLCSDKAGFVTGHMLAVDGGFGAA